VTGEALFEGLRVVELADDPAGEMLGKLLSQMGATVIKVEPPQGAPSRHVGPWSNGRADIESSLTFWFYNPGKQSLVIDLDSESGRRQLRDEALQADIFISTAQPARCAELGLDYAALTRESPSTVFVSVTPFGLTGPRADYAGSDLVCQATSGLLITSGYDDHDIPPIAPGGGQAFHTAATFGYLGVLLALLQRQVTGAGGLIDVAMHDTCAVTTELASMYWEYPQALVQRQTCRHAQPSPTAPATFECADGRYIYFILILAETKFWLLLVDWLDEHGLAADLKDEPYLDYPHRQKMFPHIQGLLEAFFSLLDASDAYHEGQRHGLPVGILNAPEDLFDNEHLAAREFFIPMNRDGVDVAFPGPPYRFSTIPAPPLAPAPHLGNATVASGPMTARSGS
jgi:crotonobetainyl-CoA:carnitine CoA-transferase CaiB-like acyl-CoA transferase